MEYTSGQARTQYTDVAALLRTGDTDDRVESERGRSSPMLTPSEARELARGRRRLRPGPRERAPEAPNPPLGIYTEIRDNPQKLASDAEKRRDRRRLEWARHRQACELVALDERIQGCRRYGATRRMEDGSLVTLTPAIRAGDDGAVWADTTRCGSACGCPLCAPYQAEIARKALERVVDSWRDAGHGVLMVTFTVPHGPEDGLAEIKAGFDTCFQSLWRDDRAMKDLREEIGLLHEYRNRETTVGDWSGWHHHRHCLWFLDGPVECTCGVEPRKCECGAWWPCECGGKRQRCSCGDPLRDRLALAFVAAMKRQGWLPDDAGETDNPIAMFAYEHCVDVRLGYGSVAEYMAKWGHEERWSLAAETTKSRVKAGKSFRSQRFTPFQLLDAIMDGHKERAQLGEWFNEYYTVMKGCHNVQWSRGSKLALGYDEAAALAEKEINGRAEVLRTTVCEVRAIRACDGWVPLLERVEMGGRGAAIADLAAMVERAIPVADRWLGLDGRWRYTDGRADEAAPRPIPSLDCVTVSTAAGTVGKRNVCVVGPDAVIADPVFEEEEFSWF